jgi:hypothetical protein
MATTASSSNRSQNAGKAVKPIFTCRHRALKAAVWQNEIDNGAIMYNTTISRSYKTDNDEWHESQSFGWEDLLIVAELLRTCYGFISREMAKQGEKGK